MTTGICFGRLSLRMNASVSRPAVPLPIAIASTLYFFTTASTSSAASAWSRAPFSG